MPASFVREARARFTESDGSANLGNGLSIRFRAIFDLSRGSLHLHPGPDWEREFSRERAGLAIVLRDGAAEVVHVSEGSPARAAGWHVGDRIRAVDGEPVDGSYWGGLGRWTDRAAGTRVTLDLEGGESRVLVLANAY